MSIKEPLESTDELFKSLSRYVQGLSEEQLRALLRDLLIAMGFKEVTITHGTLERGRDLVFFEEDKMRRRVWRGIQAKAIPLSGSLTSDKGLREALRQCEVGLEKAFTTTRGESVHLSEMWLVTNCPLSEHAKEAAPDFGGGSRIAIFDSGDLVDLIRSYFPDILQSGSTPLQSYLTRLVHFCDSPDEYFAVRFGIHFSLARVFVQPGLLLSVLPPSVIEDYDQAAPTFVRDLRGELPTLALLAREKELPAVDAQWLAVVLDRLKRLAAFIRSYSPDSKDSVAHDIVALLKQVDFTTSGRDLSSWSAGITADAVKSVLPSEDPKKELPYELIAHAYRYQTGNDHPHAKAVIEAKKRFALRHSDPEVDRYRDTIAESMSVVEAGLHRVDGVFRQRYKHIVSELPNYQASANDIPLISAPTDLTNFAELARIAAFFVEAGAASRDLFTAIRCDSFALARAVPRLTIVGDLGRGKTTFLKRLCREITNTVNTNGRGEEIPIFCKLALLRAPTTSLEGALRETARLSNSGMPSFVGGSAWLLDGFDEIESHGARGALLEWIATDQSSANVYLTSRPNAMPLCLASLTPAELPPFHWNSIQEFTIRFPWPNPADSDHFLNLLRAHTQLRELASNPLLLTLMIMIGIALGLDKVPVRRDAIYSEIIRLMLFEWDRKKGLTVRHVIADDDACMLMLARCALDLYKAGATSTTRSNFRKLCDVNLVGLGLQPDVADEFFDELVRDCILVPQTGGYESFTFFHLSVQEYLAAFALTRDISPSRLWDIIQEYHRTGWWEEVLVLYAAIKRDIEYLLNDLQFFTETLHREERRRHLVRRWLEVADLTAIGNLRALGSRIVEEALGRDS